MFSSQKRVTPTSIPPAPAVIPAPTPLPFLTPRQHHSPRPTPPHPHTTRPNTTPRFPLVTPCDPSLLPPPSLNPQGIRHHLRNYPDPAFPQLLSDISRFGVRVGYEGPSHARIRRPNHRSATVNPAILDDHITKELAAGRIQKVPLPLSHYCSPLGLVPKKTDGVQTGWRMNFDLSSPAGHSVNNNIPLEYGTLTYESFQDALALIASFGQGAVLLKKDLKAAFRHVPMSPYDYWLFIFEWKGEFFMDMFLPFGLQTAPYHFNLFAEGLHWVFVYEYGWSLTHYLDDSLSVFPPNTDPKPLSTLYDSVCKDFGMHTEPKKDEMGTRVTHLSFTIDSHIMEASLPPNKRKRAITVVHNLLLKSWTSRARLEETLGFLSHCCQVVPIGRPFLRNLFSLLQISTRSACSGRPPYARLTHAAHQDQQWWYVFLNLWSCSIPIQSIDARRTFMIATDASGKKGIGGVFGELVVASRVLRGHRRKHINWKELYAIYYALLLWFEHFANGRLVILCDNTTAVAAVNKRSTCESLTPVLQALLLVAALFNIDLVTRWIPTDENSVADALSRHDFKRLANLGFVTQASILHRPHPTIPTSTLRQKLLSFCGTASPSPPENRTPPPSKHTNPSSYGSTSQRSPSRSSSLQPGSPTSPPPSPSQRPATTSKASATTTSNTISTYKSSTTPSLTLLFVAGGASTVINPTANVFLSRRTSSSPSSISSPPTRASTPLISEQPSVSPSQHSSGLANLHGKNGILKSLLGFIYHDDMLHSSTTPSLSSSRRRKQTNTAKVSTSTSPASIHPSVPWPPSTTYSNGSRRRPTPHFSFGQLAYLSTEPTSSIELRHGYSKRVKIPRSSQDTHSAKVPLSQQSPPASLRTKSNFSVVGKATPSTSTSTRSTNTPTDNICLPSTQKSTPPLTQPIFLASSPTSRSTLTSSSPTRMTYPACQVRRISAVPLSC